MNSEPSSTLLLLIVACFGLAMVFYILGYWLTRRADQRERDRELNAELERRQQAFREHEQAVAREAYLARVRSLLPPPSPPCSRAHVSPHPMPAPAPAPAATQAVEPDPSVVLALVATTAVAFAATAEDSPAPSPIESGGGGDFSGGGASGSFD